MNGQIQNGQVLYENILAVEEANDKKDNTELELKKKRKLSIEEIKLVRVAVSAFKKKQRLRDLKKGRKKTKTSFASVVEKVMHLREKENKRFYTAKQRTV